MPHLTAQPAPTTAPALATPRTYQPPQVQDLGPWQAVTLLYTLPIGPGGVPVAGPQDSGLF